MQLRHLPGNDEQTAAHRCGETLAGLQRDHGPPDHTPVQVCRGTGGHGSGFRQGLLSQSGSWCLEERVEGKLFGGG